MTTSSRAVRTAGGAGVTGSDPSVLVGEWSLDRRLRDRSSGTSGRATGTLTIAPSAGAGPRRLTWAEKGVVTWSSGYAADFTRDYLITERPEGWWMEFADGGAFHPWSPGRDVEHPCRADMYSGYVDVDPTASRMRILWLVTGPSKDQRIITRFRRVPEQTGRPTRRAGG